MSARLEEALRYCRMEAGDVEAVVAVERDIYSHPWTPGNFRDSLEAGYHCWTLKCAGAVTGYTVLAVAAGEAHLLNLSVARAWQRRGLGRELLRFALRLARDYGARTVFLEVRPSNAAARALYAGAGFTEIGVRRGYYPAAEGREDAIVLQLALRA